MGASSNASTAIDTDTTSDPATVDPGDNNTQTMGANLTEGDKAPDFSYTTVDGQSGKLSELRGQVVFINFWASWCGPCMQEMPDINELHAAYPDVAILEINVSDDRDDAMAFIEEADYDVNWIIDDGSINALYPSAGIPYTLVLNEFGTIMVIYEGSAPNMFEYFEAAVITAGA